MGYFLLTSLLVVSMFLMLVVLIQRGRGGGLAGAFGALGGQSAFGTKAGDVFTVITIVTATIWVALACLTGWRLRVEADAFFAGREGGPDKVQVAPVDESPTGEASGQAPAVEPTGDAEKKAEKDDEAATPAEKPGDDKVPPSNTKDSSPGETPAAAPKSDETKPSPADKSDEKKE
jgi:preprotein translocase subunit SecG